MVDVNVDVNKIVITKADKKAAPIRATYYLDKEVIKQINKISKQTKIGKSQLVNQLLSECLKNIEIQDQKNEMDLENLEKIPNL